MAGGDMVEQAGSGVGVLDAGRGDQDREQEAEGLARWWRAERHRRWPTRTNPYLLVTVCTAVDDTHPAVNPQAITKPLRRLGLQVGRLRMDRILDEAKHTSDPVHLIRLFGLSPCTAMQYVRAAHPYGGDPSPL
ncbi:hypothetical protein [Streptomyces sp. NPDC001137]|uniref:hypothetical protein n=1 Tax=Streptomyces sp. NPDC001137 TaxID=3154378 RepID=UPI003331B273